jgi:hypothetical protein
VVSHLFQNAAKKAWTSGCAAMITRDEMGIGDWASTWRIVKRGGLMQGAWQKLRDLFITLNMSCLEGETLRF